MSSLVVHASKNGHTEQLLQVKCEIWNKNAHGAAYMV